MLDRIPRPLLVFAVLLIGVGMLFVIQKPHSVCDNQLVLFKEAQAGTLYPRVVKANSQRPAIFPRLLDNCKIGNSPGACFELFTSLRKFLRDLNGSPQECLVPFGEVPEVRSALTKGSELLVMLAWGAQPPDPLSKLGWLETLDLSLYCQLKSAYLKVYGSEAWDQFRQATQAKLPGEAEQMKDGQCVNCENLKRAPAVLTAEEIWTRSLFSLRCDQFN